MKILNTETLAEQGNLTVARLEEHVSQGSSFSFEFPGWGFEEYHEGDEYEIVHNEEVIFHGWLDSVKQSNTEGKPKTSLTVLDEVAHLAKITSQLQEEEVKVSSETSFDAVSRHSNIACYLGGAFSSKTVSIRGVEYKFAVSPKMENCAYVKRTGGIHSTGKILRSIRNAHPDLTLSVNWETKTIHIESNSEKESEIFDTDVVPVQIGSISPDFSHTLKGVLVTTPRADKNESVIYRIPATVSIHEHGVKIIRASEKVKKQAVTQAYQMWQKSSALYYNCSITVPMSAAHGSMLGKNLSLQGRGTAPQWNGMLAPITRVVWDFVSKNVNITTENAQEDYDIPDDTSFPSDADFPGVTPEPGPGPGPEPGESSEESESGESGTGEGTALTAAFLPPVDFEPLPATHSFWLTLRWTANLPCNFSILVDDGKMPWLVQPDQPNHIKLTLPYGSYRFVLTATTKEQPLQEVTDVQMYAYSPKRTGEGGTITGGTQTRGKITEGKTIGPTHCCQCKEKWDALEIWKREIERRIKALEDMTCDCAAIIHDEAQQVARTLSLHANVMAVEVSMNDNGTVLADTTVDVNATSINSDSNLHY